MVSYCISQNTDILLLIENLNGKYLTLIGPPMYMVSIFWTRWHSHYWKNMFRLHTRTIFFWVMP